MYEFVISRSPVQSRRVAPVYFQQLPAISPSRVLQIFSFCQQEFADKTR